MRFCRLFAPALVVTALLTACVPGRPDDGTRPPSAGSERQGGTLKVAWQREPDGLSPKFLGGSGNAEYQWVFTSTLTFLDMGGDARPLLAAEIPTQANGGWVINPDGTMVTTYKLRPNATWHDGRPLTASDFVFAHQVYVDPEIRVLKPSPEPLMAQVEARDDHTLVIRWKQLFVHANTLGQEQMIPLPRHQLEAKYRSDKANFASGDEWLANYVSAGPFMVESYTPGAGIRARAHPGFVLGPPKLDAIEIRFIADPNAQVANLLSGEVDAINSPGVRAPEAVVVRDQLVSRGDGSIKSWVTNASYLEWQFRDVPNWQRAVADIRVRKALLHAIDRDGLTETVNHGFAPAAHAFIATADRLFPEVDRVISKYPYDPNRARSLLAEAGWGRPSSSGLLSNTAGQPLDMELLTTPGQEQQATIIVDNWKSVGVNSTLNVIPQARVRDGELRSNFIGAGTNGRGLDIDGFVWGSADELPTAENRWSGSNRGSFYDPEINRLYDLRVGSLDENQRRQATIDQIKRMTELVGPAPFLYSVEVILARTGVAGPMGATPAQDGVTWNCYEWELIR